MIGYEEFKNYLIENFLDYLPDYYGDMEADISFVDKVNGKKEMLSLKGSGPGINISPAVSVDHIYADYAVTEDLGLTFRRTADSFVKAMGHKDSIDVSELVNAENAKDKIVFQLINTEQNKEMLEDVPHREFHDLSVIYRMVVGVDAEGLCSSRINNRLAENLGFSEEQLFKFAAENTKRLLPPVIKSMNDVMMEIFEKNGMPSEIAAMFEDVPPVQQMYVITNGKGINGAASMLYEDGLHDLAKKLGSDLYILPSSIHEVIAVSADMGDPGTLAEMVAEVNMGHVELDERLSNQVYHYDKDLRKISLATDTPNKKLDTVSTGPHFFNNISRVR